MRYILTTIVAVLMALPVFSQNESGIFLCAKCARGSDKFTTLVEHKPVCLAAHPIILTAEFVAITDMQSKEDRIWFDVTLSQKAIKLMSQLAVNLPSAKFALVIDQEAFVTFMSTDVTPNRTFRFLGNEKDYLTFSEMQKELKSLIASHTQ